MSVYRPDPDGMTVIARDNGWVVEDRHGFYDGPYQTYHDAMSIIHAIRDEIEAEAQLLAARFPQRREADDD